MANIYSVVVLLVAVCLYEVIHLMDDRDEQLYIITWRYAMKTYCENCHMLTEYTTKDTKLFGKVKGIYYEYDGKQCYCEKCGNLVHPKEIHKLNLQALQNEARRYNYGILEGV